MYSLHISFFFFFFFNDTATTEIYTLSLHDALPISSARRASRTDVRLTTNFSARSRSGGSWSPLLSRPSAIMALTCRDRKSTRLNSSHGYISYAVFCLKKKKKKKNNAHTYSESV